MASKQRALIYSFRFQISIISLVLALMVAVLATTFHVATNRILDLYDHAMEEASEQSRFMRMESLILLAKQEHHDPAGAYDVRRWGMALTHLKAAASDAVELVTDSKGDAQEFEAFTKLHEDLNRYADMVQQVLATSNRDADTMARLNRHAELVVASVEILAEHIQSEMGEVRHNVQRDSRNSLYAGWSIAAAAMLLSLLVTFWLVRRLNRRLADIAVGVRHVAKGRLSHPIEVPSDQARRNELDQIGADINQAASHLAEAREKAEQERAQVERVSAHLAKFFSPQVRDRILSGQWHAEIISRRRKLTVFFSDLVGFTRATESLEAEDLTALLNDYLNEMSQIALTHGGVIDKYIGDAILVFFGDGEGEPDPREGALAAVRMAVAMQQRMTVLRRRWANQGTVEPFRVRMGIATGYCAVGNFGSHARMDYTIIGNTVNLASRLESRAEPGGLLMNHETYVLVRDRFPCLVEEPITVKGVREPVRVYSVKPDALEKQASAEMVVAHEGQGYTLFIDTAQVDAEHRRRISKDLQGALKRMEQLRR